MKALKYIKKFIFILFTASLIACVDKNELMTHDWALDVQNANTREAHLLLADHYESIAEQMDADAEEERRMLGKYQALPFKYGKQILNLNARAEGMINHFEKAAEDSRKMANYHRRFAQEKPKVMN